MSTYRGVAYELRWAGRREWVIFQQPRDGAGVCESGLECSFGPDDWRALAETSVKAVIDALIERRLIEPAN
jgi:hypothetical protein